MKTKQIFALLLFVVTILSTSCSKSKAELLIPQDAFAVITTNPSDLAKKGGDDLVDLFKKAQLNTTFTPGVTAIVKPLIEDPVSSGIKLTSDLYIFSDETKAGVAFDLSSGSNFKALVEKFQSEGMTQPLEEKEGISIARIDAESAIYFDADRAMVLVSYTKDLTDAPLAQFKQTDKNSILAQKGYTKLKSNAKDLNFWFKNSAINSFRKLNRNLAFADFSQLPDMDYYVSTEFKKGEIVFENSTYSDDPKAKEQSNQSKKILVKTSSKFLQYIPQGSFAAMNIGLSFEEIFKYMREDEQLAQTVQQLPQEMIDVFSFINGSVTAAVFSVDKPRFVIYAETKGEGALARLSAAFGPMLRCINDKTIVVGNDIYVTERKNYLCITTEEATAMNPETEASPSINKEDFAKVLSESNYLSMTAKAPLEITSSIAALQEFEFVEMRAQNQEEAEFIIHFKDKKKNSLAKLFEISSSFIK